MTSVLLQPWSKGFDAASFKTYTQWGKVVRAGGQWVSMYLGGTFGVTQATIEGAWAVGLGVMLNYERSARAALNGYPQGVQHATEAMQQAQAFAFHGEAPLIFSGADFGPTDAQMPMVLDYHRALVDTYTLGIGGAYGPKKVLEKLAQQDWWPADWPLWHWGGDGSQIYPWTWVKQGPGPSYYNETIGLQVDDNMLYKPMKFWSGYGQDPDPPEVDVATRLEIPGLFTLISPSNGTAHPMASHIQSPDEDNYWKSVAPTQQIALSDCAGIHLIGQPPTGYAQYFKSTYPQVTQGPQGPKGDTGPQGPPGSQGIQGNPGKDAPTPKSFTPVY